MIHPALVSRSPEGNLHSQRSKTMQQYIGMIYNSDRYQIVIVHTYSYWQQSIRAHRSQIFQVFPAIQPMSVPFSFNIGGSRPERRHGGRQHSCASSPGLSLDRSRAPRVAGHLQTWNPSSPCDTSMDQNGPPRADPTENFLATNHVMGPPTRNHRIYSKEIMHKYMYMYICTHICTHTHTYIYIYAYLLIYSSIYLFYSYSEMKGLTCCCKICNQSYLVMLLLMGNCTKNIVLATVQQYRRLPFDVRSSFSTFTVQTIGRRLGQGNAPNE